MTDTWQERMAERLTAPDPEPSAPGEPAAPGVSRPPAPRWAERLAERALTSPEDTTTPPNAA